MIKNIKKALLLGIVLLSTQINAQLKKGQLVDGIAAVIGNEIVLESDITEQENHAKQMGEKISGDNCEVVQQTSSISCKKRYSNPKQKQGNKRTG